MSIDVKGLRAVEILDSRSRPTLSIELTTQDGARYWAGVPSGASTGTREAVELRDGDPKRYGGQGVQTAVAGVCGELADTLGGRSFANQAEFDQAMIELDGTPEKSRLGANAIVGVSMAAARAFAGDTPAWQTLSVAGAPPRMPVPHFNVINGGAHARNDLDFQEFMIAPVGAPDMAEAVRAGAEIYAALKARLAREGHATGLGDEGGFAPNIALPEDALTVLVAAIGDAGYEPGREGVAIAIDPASSEFYQDGTYRVAGQSLTSAQMIDYYAELVDRFPIWSLEDGLAEQDWGGWEDLTARLGGRIQIVGDDIFVTNPTIIGEAIARKIGNAALIKLNQIGTVSETLEAMEECHRNGYAAMVSHRSGETEDSFIADLTVGTGCGQLKSGAPARGERVAKYNRLLEIAADNVLPFGLVP